MITAGVLIISAPSGAGKTSLARALVADNPTAGLTVSHTTRAIRPGEIDGVHYHFVDRQEFESMIEQDMFVEFAEVFDNFYGTSVTAINAQLESGMHAILDIDWQGARKVRQKFTDAESVFVMPPSLEALEQRLRNRGQDSDQVIARRMRDARSEISHKEEYAHIIINDDFDRALGELKGLLESL